MKYLPLSKALSRSLCLARQAARGMSFITSLLLPESGVSSWLLPQMLSERGKRIKTDSRDARLIAKCLCCNWYHPVVIPAAEDEAVRDYLRMIEDHQGALKKLK